MKKYFLIIQVVLLIVYLALFLNIKMIIKKNQNIPMEKIRQMLSKKIILSIILTVIIGIMSIVLIFIK